MSFDTWVRLVDISRYQQGANDFAALARGGYVGAVQRWGVGTYRDPTRFTNLRAIIAAGLVPGTYLVPGANTGSGADQAARFVAEVREAFGTQPILYVGDVEHSNSFGDPSAALAADFFATLHRLTGRPAGAYIPKWYMDGHAWTASQVAAIAPHAWWWQSRYVTSPTFASPPDARGYQGWPLRAWQWTSSGPAPGIPGDVDKNVFYGTLAQLRAAAGYDQENDMELSELLNSGEFWNRMTASTKGTSEAAMQHVLDRNARKVFGITDTEAYLEALLAAARKGAALKVPTADEIALAVLAKLPPASTGGLTKQDVHDAVAEVFAEVRYTTAPADVPTP